jgi:hypothetical protein
MDLPERIEDINYWLERDFGKTGLYPNWRVVWSEDQFEMVKGRFVTYDNSNNIISTQEGVAQVRKYEYIKEKFILERIMPVPELNREELVGREWSYEPLWVFEDKNGNWLPPKMEVCKIVIDSVLKASARAIGARYKNPEDDQDPIEVRKMRIDKLQEELFGNETDAGDALAHGSGIVVPHNFEKGKIH